MSTPYESYRHPSCRNVSGEIIPAFGVLRVTNLTIINAVTVLDVDKPNGTGGQHVINGPVPIPVQSHGNYFDGAGMFPVYSSSVTLGDIVGPIAGSWEAGPAASGFEIFGEIKTSIAMASRQVDGGGAMFPISLEKVGGYDGSSTEQCSWRYNIKAYKGTVVIKADVNPGLPPHEYRRPNLGKMTQATFGTALYHEGEIVVASTNETDVRSTC